MSNAEIEEVVEHGASDAYYSNIPGPKQSAIILCLCGYSATAWTPSWEDAGRDFDAHLEEESVDDE